MQQNCIILIFYKLKSIVYAISGIPSVSYFIAKTQKFCSAIQKQNESAYFPFYIRLIYNKTVIENNHERPNQTIVGKYGTCMLHIKSSSWSFFIIYSVVVITFWLSDTKYTYFKCLLAYAYCSLVVFRPLTTVLHLVLCCVIRSRSCHL